MKNQQNQKAGWKKLPEELEQFLKELSWDIDKSRLDIREERVYYMPENLPMLKGVRFLRSGLLLGEVKKNRLSRARHWQCV